MLIVIYTFNKNLLIKLERFYAIIFDVVYASSTFSSLLSALGMSDKFQTTNRL